MATLLLQVKVTLRKCEFVTQYLLPLFRALVARQLIDEFDLSQIETAKKLRTTQPAISQYLSGRRGLGRMEEFGFLVSDIRNVADETAKSIATGDLRDEELTRRFCRFCRSFQHDELVGTCLCHSD